jgi:hypothetical protein
LTSTAHNSSPRLGGEFQLDPLDERSAYWFRLPDDEAWLMSLRPAELKSYLVVSRAIQRDRNGGKICERQVAQRAGVGLRHVHAALSRLVGMNRLRREGKPGSTATYYLPHSWNTGNRAPTGEQSGQLEMTNRIPTGKQLGPTQAAKGKQQRSPTGEQNCTPTGERHLESLEYSEQPAAAAAARAAFIESALASRRIPHIPEPIASRAVAIIRKTGADPIWAGKKYAEIAVRSAENRSIRNQVAWILGVFQSECEAAAENSHLGTSPSDRGEYFPQIKAPSQDRPESVLRQSGGTVRNGLVPVRDLMPAQMRAQVES